MVVATGSDWVLAHQGGWDEVMFVAVPIIVILGLLRFAKYRIDKEKAELAAGERAADEPVTIEDAEDTEQRPAR